MTEEQYLQLCEACDNILLEQDSNIERISIAWLHVVREHPEFLKNYETLFLPSNIKRIFTSSLKNLVIKLKNIYSFKNYFKEKSSFWISSNEEVIPLDILIVSHLLNKSEAGNKADQYFNDIINYLVDSGFPVGIILINHTNLKTSEVAKKWGNSNITRFILSPILPVSNELKIRKSLKKESLKLKNKAKNQSTSILLKNILLRASEEAISNQSYQILRLNEQLKSLFKMINPKLVMSTYEGHAYERVIFHAAKTFNKKVTCIGYQHASIFRLQHGIKRSLKKNYDPDFILTSGLIGKQKIEKYSNFKNTTVTILGSDRGISNKDLQINKTSSKNKQCLVLPEGTLNECKILFEFSVHCAIENPNVIFIWRLHPILNFNTLRKKLSLLNFLPKNIILSNNSFEEDLLNVDYALYRGTTAIIKAVSHKIKPIYLSIPGELTVDMLYQTNHWKRIISKVEDFKKIIDEPFIIEEDFNNLISHCQNLFTEFDWEVLLPIIRNSLKTHKSLL